MKPVNIVISEKDPQTFKGELLVAFAARTAEGRLVCDKLFEPLLHSLDDIDEFTGKKEQCLQLYPGIGGKEGRMLCKRLLFVGLGEIDPEAENHSISELFRTAGGVVAGQCKKNKAVKIAVALPGFAAVDETVFAEYMTEGILLGSYQFLKYKSEEKKEEFPGLKKLTYFCRNGEASLQEAVTRATNSARSTCTARDMANEPGNGWTPKHFAEYARDCAKKYNMQCKVLDKSHMKKLGMEGILGVNKGSAEPPKLIILEYNPGKVVNTILLVGKGLTFDSGGISLKPAQGMMDMKYDMCGGAAVLSAMEAIAAEKPDVRVVALVPSTDNMAGGAALKPGDVIKHYGGITSEIENTDAEGRLILADALAYGIEKFKPDCVVDLATLTGAVIIALGHHYSGLMSNNDVLAEKLAEASRISGEPLWRLPLGESYREQIKSKVADIKNTGGRPAGSITAAEYLHRFVGEVPWAHLDIAGTAWDFTEKSYIPKGPSGFGVRILIELVRRWENDVLGTGQ
ncbi:MAG: leucyl aminopeptidase [Desulforhopalus sp.]